MAQLTVDIVGTAISRPPNNCNAMIRISAGNKIITAFGDGILFAKLHGRGALRSESKITMPAGGRHTYANSSRPYDIHGRLYDKPELAVLKAHAKEFPIRNS